MELNNIKALETTAVTAGLSLLLAAVLFFPATNVQDYLTNSGWLYLSVFLCGLSVWGWFSKNPIELPNNRTLVILGAYFSLLFIFSIINRSTFLEERWIQRYIFILTFFICVQYLNSEQKIISHLKLPLYGFLTFLTIESLYQYISKCQLNDPLGRSCYSSRFWNINMLAQSLALSLPFLILFLKYSKSKIDRFFNYFLIVLCTLVTLLTACRSAILSISIFYSIEFIFPQVISRKKVFLTGLCSLILFFSFNSFKNNLSNSIGEDKKGSAGYRLEVWKKSVGMAIENPLGIGVNNFEFGFLPYKMNSNFDNMMSEVDKSPHNEFVRVLSEEGWVLFLTFSFSVLVVVFCGLRAFLKKQHSVFFFKFFLVLLPELFFQFPTEMFFPVFLFSIALSTNTQASVKIAFSHLKYTALVLASLFLFSLICIRNVKTVPKEYSGSYCRVFPDNWKMCGEYFKEHYENGDLHLADQTIKPVIKRQPFNYIALHFDYMLGDQIHNSKIACNYWNIFSGKNSIPESDVSSCIKLNKPELINSFKQYAKQR